MPRKNRTRYTILGLLAGEPLSGYDIRRAIEETIGHFWSESYGQIYPALRHLAEGGLVTRRRTSREGRPSRNVYSLTAKGRQELEGWLAEPAEADVERRELLLKIFFAAQGSPGVSFRHIQRHRDDQLRRVEILARIEARLRRLETRTPQVSCWLATIRHGRLAAEAGLQWCDEAEELLASASSGH
jgi:DNA-binding PadR family transcriptional regulator